MAMNYSDLFSGTVTVVGLDYYRPLESPDPPPRSWYHVFTRPSRRLLDVAKAQVRFALIAGERDFNRLAMKAIHGAMVEDGFANLTYFEVPGLAHGYPGAGWFEKAVISLDRPPPSTPRSRHRADIAHKRLGQARRQMQSDPENGMDSLKRIGRAMVDTPAGRRAWFDAFVRLAPPDTSVVPSADKASGDPDAAAEAGATKAKKALQMAVSFVKIQEYEQARTYLRQILHDHPDSPEAVEAFKLLRKLPK
jgi:hypothetical protein